MEISHDISNEDSDLRSGNSHWRFQESLNDSLLCTHRILPSICPKPISFISLRKEKKEVSIIPHHRHPHTPHLGIPSQHTSSNPYLTLSLFIFLTGCNSIPGKHILFSSLHPSAPGPPSIFSFAAHSWLAICMPNHLLYNLRGNCDA